MAGSHARFNRVENSTTFYSLFIVNVNFILIELHSKFVIIGSDGIQDKKIIRINMKRNDYSQPWCIYVYCTDTMYFFRFVHTNPNVDVYRLY